LRLLRLVSDGLHFLNYGALLYFVHKDCRMVLYKTPNGEIRRIALLGNGVGLLNYLKALEITEKD
jgi:hypothetical protein